MKVKQTPIAAAVSLTLLGAAFAAQAQQTDAPAKPDTKPQQLEQVVVTGIRASLQQSLTQKKNAESIVEVITAEDVGKMPDKNVADSLQRVPGVNTTSAGSAEGSFGENEHVQMRGISSQYTLTTLNGHTVSTGDWYGPNMRDGGRSVTFTLLPSDLIGRAVIHKSSQADITEGGAAGTVDIQTRHPLDFKERFGGVVSAEVARSDAAGTNDPSVSALIHWKNESNTFGILGQVFSQERHLRRAGSEGVWWDSYGMADPGNAAGISNLIGKQVSYLSGAVLFEQERKRQGAYLEADLKVSPDLSFNLSGFYSKLDAKNSNTNFMAGITGAVNNWSAHTQVPSSSTVTGNTVTSIFFPANTFANDAAYSVVEDVALRPDAKTDSKFVNLDGRWVVSEQLSFTSKLGYTEGNAHTKDVGFEVLSGWNQGAGYTLSPEGIFVLNVPGGDKFHPYGAGIGGWGSDNKSKDKETYGQVDGTYKLASDLFPQLKFGARATTHTRTYTQWGLTRDPASSNEALIPADAIGNYPANWYGDLPVNPTPGFLPFKISDAFVKSWLDKYGSFPTITAQYSYEIKEKTQAGYLMADLNPYDNVTGNIGLRVVHTSNSNVVSYGSAPYESSRTDLLPSLNLRADMAKNVVARFALSRSMARPDYGQFAGVDLRDLQHTGVTGNPLLKPVISTNVDASAEWYFAPRSLVSAGVFASKLNGVIGFGSTTLPFQNTSKPGNPVENYLVSAPINSSGQLTGFEAQYQQALFGGFGIDANFTHVNGKLTQKNGTCNGTPTEDCSLYGTSKDTYNFGAFYENDWLSARLAYNHRSSYKLGNRGAADFFQSGSGQLNFALNLNFMKDATFTFEAQNLTDPLQTVYKTNFTQIAGVYKTGKMYYAGLRYKF